MAKWTLNGVQFDISPQRDTGWYPELVLAKQHIPNSNTTLLQVGGRQSEIRKAEGFTKSSTVLQTLIGSVGNSVSLTDHHGNTNTVFVESVITEEVMDITNMTTGTFKYTISMIKVS